MKQKLLQLIRTGAAKEQSDLLPHVNDVPAERPGAWTAKDQLAHLMAWRQVAAAELDAVRTGGPGPDVSDDDDLENAKIYEATHHQTAASLRDAGKRSWDQLAAAVGACSEEDLAKPRTRQPGQPVWQVVSNSSYSHLAEHLGSWAADHGDETKAEEAAKWGHDQAVAAFPDAPGRGVAAYNLGCFYAKRGRAGEAIPLLRTGIELRPDLREWARQDSDLDPIRTVPEVAALLA